MELGKYIRLKKDFINSEIMELAAESALLRLIRQTGKNTEELCESDQDNSSFHYKEEYQGLFDKYYDEAYDRIAGLIKFDVAQDDGIDKGTKEAVLCEEMAYAVNGAFDYKAFAERLAEEHPTVQQCMFCLMRCAMLHMASWAIRIDDRNRAAFELCSNVADILEKHHLPMV